MKKKSLLTMVVALALVGAVGVGATLAYLSSTTGTLTNTFTLGDTNITIDEPSWEGDVTDIVPGQEIAKDPTVTVAANSVDSYVFMSVSGIEEMMAAGFEIDGISADWTYVEALSSDYDGQVAIDGIYVYKNVVEQSGDAQELAPLFNNVTYVNSNEKLGENAQVNFEILVKAAAVQADEIAYEVALDEVRAALNDFDAE